MRATRTSTGPIAFVTTMAGGAWGGSEELWSQTALRLAETGHQVAASVYEWPSCPEPVLALQRAGVDVTFRPLKKSRLQKLVDKGLRRLNGCPADRSLRAWLERVNPDLVVISQGMPWEGAAWMLACRDAGVPYCPVVHANSESWWPVNEQFDAALRGYGAAERVFFVSRANQRMTELQCGVRFEHGEVVVNPWKGGTGESLAWPGDGGTTKLACVGRVDPKAKGQDLLMQVMALPKWRERPVEVNIYGGGPCERALEGLRQMLDLKNVRFAGHVADVETIWAENHALILPSRFEGLPLVIIEAMRHGRPVITTNVAGNAEYLTEGGTGFVAAAPTLDLLDDAMERAWAKRAAWREMGLAARAHLAEALPADPIGVFSRRLLDLTGRPAT